MGLFSRKPVEVEKLNPDYYWNSPVSGDTFLVGF